MNFETLLLFICPVIVLWVAWCMNRNVEKKFSLSNPDVMQGVITYIEAEKEPITLRLHHHRGLQKWRIKIMRIKTNIGQNIEIIDYKYLVTSDPKVGCKVRLLKDEEDDYVVNFYFENRDNNFDTSGLKALLIIGFIALMMPFLLGLGFAALYYIREYLLQENVQLFLKKILQNFI